MAGSKRRFRHDDEERKKWMDPEAILEDIGLEPGTAFADLGCGEGFFALPAARMVGETGHVYAMDINPEAVERLAETATEEGLANISVMTGAGEDDIFCEACADVVFLGVVFHEFHDASLALRNARAMLRPGGRLIDLDWKKKPTEKGPPLEERVDEDMAVRLISKAGFKVETVKDMGPWHYLITARPEA